MKYLKFFFKKIIYLLKYIFTKSLPFLFIALYFFLSLLSEGYTFEDFGLDGFSLNPNDYCNITDVDYTAVLCDNPDGKANVEITEYLTFDVHASSRSNTFKELWRELPEDIVDGLRITYNVKSVTQILENGQEINYKQTPKMYWEDEDYTSSSTYYWHHSKGSGNYPDNDESLLIYIPWTYREKMTFKIVYTMNNAALKYKDCSELYLSMYSGNTITKLKSYKAQILIPQELMPSTYHSYTFGTSKNRINFQESNLINPGFRTFKIDLDESDLKFNYHNRYIEFCLLAYGKDKHIFTKYAPMNLYTHENALEECIAENQYYETQNQKYNTYKKLLLTASIILACFVIYITKLKLKNIKKRYDLYKPEIDYEYFRDIPSDLDPIFASELVFMKDPFNENKEKKEEYAAILLSLARKKYVKLVKIDDRSEWDEYSTRISLTPLQVVSLSSDPITAEDITSEEPVYKIINEATGEELEPLTTSERLYYELLERHSKTYSNIITISALQYDIDHDPLYTNAFIKDMEKKPALENGVINGYFSEVEYDVLKKKLEKNAKSSLKFGLFLLTAVNLISYFTPLSFAFGAYTILGIALLWRYIYLNEKSNDVLLFTQYGINEQAKWYGLYNFLNSDTLLHEKEIQDIVLWEKYLIYATAFGISKKVIKAIKINAVKLNIDDSPILNNRCYTFSRNFHTTSRSLGRSIHTTSRGGGSFGSGFSGHGYGGGGRGGGGGGGGH